MVWAARPSHSSSTRALRGSKRQQCTTHSELPVSSYQLVRVLSIKVQEKTVSLSTCADGAEGEPLRPGAGEACACGGPDASACVFLRYDHTRPSAAAGGAVGTMPHGVPSPGFHSPRPASELTASIVKTNLHEPGKREKRTLVLRDRSE